MDSLEIQQALDARFFYVRVMLRAIIYMHILVATHFERSEPNLLGDAFDRLRTLTDSLVFSLITFLELV